MDAGPGAQGWKEEEVADLRDGIEAKEEQIALLKGSVSDGTSSQLALRSNPSVLNLIPYKLTKSCIYAKYNVEPL